MTFKRFILDNIKNIWGWTTSRKIVVISVDDYGNVRLDSSKARMKMDEKGLKVYDRFDAFDTLETKDDLSMLYETLTSVKDKQGRPAVFTPFSMPCNINFEKMAEANYEKYEYELLPITYAKLSGKDPKAYEGTWCLWQDGIDKGIMKPQFHGREHLNLKVFKEKLAIKDQELLVALKNRSYTSISSSGYHSVGYTAAFEFDKFEENYKFKEIIKTGLDDFENVFGYRSVHFNSPGGREHPVIHQYLYDSGIEYLDTQFVKEEHQGEGKYKKVFNHTGKKNHLGMTYQVRNVLFEPTKKTGFDWVNYSLKQIETAFFWNKPAIISSHRVNFCGHIDPKNRVLGLSLLRELLQRIVKRWPNVEFISADELGEIITNKIQ